VPERASLSSRWPSSSGGSLQKCLRTAIKRLVRFQHGIPFSNLDFGSARNLLASSWRALALIRKRRRPAWITVVRRIPVVNILGRIGAVDVFLKVCISVPVFVLIGV